MKRKVVSSSRRKSRKAHFQASSTDRRRIMSAMLSRDLRKKHAVRSVPIRAKDEVKIMRGQQNGISGRVIRVRRGQFVIYVDKATREKTSGQQVHFPIHPSNVMITKLYLNQNRRDLLERKKRVSDEDKGKYTAEDMEDLAVE